MDQKPLIPVIKPEPNITCTSSIRNKSKFANPGFEFFTVKDANTGNSLTEQKETKGLSEIQILALKGNLVKSFKEHFKL